MKRQAVWLQFDFWFVYLFSSPLSDSPSWLIFWGKTTKKSICFVLFFRIFHPFLCFWCILDSFWFHPKKKLRDFFCSLTLAGFLDFGGLGLGSWQLVHQAVGDHFRPFLVAEETSCQRENDMSWKTWLVVEGKHGVPSFFLIFVEVAMFIAYLLVRRQQFDNF